MNPEFERLLKDALLLPPEARGTLAELLLDSLDSDTDPDADRAWDVEIARRQMEIDSGVVKPLAWADARREFLRAP